MRALWPRSGVRMIERRAQHETKSEERAAEGVGPYGEAGGAVCKLLLPGMQEEDGGGRLALCRSPGTAEEQVL